MGWLQKILSGGQKFDEFGAPSLNEVDNARTDPMGPHRFKGVGNSDMAIMDRMAEGRENIRTNPVAALMKGSLALPYEGIKGLAMSGPGPLKTGARGILKGASYLSGDPEFDIDSSTSPASLANPLAYLAGIGKGIIRR